MPFVACFGTRLAEIVDKLKTLDLLQNQVKALVLDNVEEAVPAEIPCW